VQRQPSSPRHSASGHVALTAREIPRPRKEERWEESISAETIAVRSCQHHGDNHRYDTNNWGARRPANDMSLAAAADMLSSLLSLLSVAILNETCIVVLHVCMCIPEGGRRSFPSGRLFVHP
jgi:hypothetical protein